jgi:putative oxidoreductase
MDQLVRAWVEEHRARLWAAGVDLLRIYMGVALVLKAAHFMQHMSAFIETMPVKQTAFMPALLAHYIVMAHAAGGIMLIFGIYTRLAAAVQVPILMGAIGLVHWNEKLFQPAQTLEFAILVLFILVLLTITGSGPWSVDEHMRKPASTPSPAPT